jgi:hypothetical protein
MAREQLGWLVFDEHACGVFGFEKTASAHVGDELDQAVEKAADVEQADRFVVKRELQPGERFEQLVQRAKTSWQRDEAIAQIDHHLLALVHAGHDMQFGDTAVAEFFFHERFGDHADDFAVL